MRLSDDKLTNLAKSIYDVGKLTFGALVLGSLISQNPFEIKYFIGGLTLFIVCFAIAFIIDR